MQSIERLRPWFGRKSVRGAVVLLVIAAAAIFLANKNTPEVEVETNALPLVSVTTPTEYAGGQSLSLVGTVRAFSEAAITAERAGRVTSVSVGLGDTVAAGRVVATLENAAEQAAVLQAQGVYEAALASAEQNGVSVSEANTALTNAQNSAVATFKSAFNTVNGTVLNSIDNFFSNPNGTIPGLEIDGRGFTNELNAERVAFQGILPTWQSKTQTIAAGSELDVELAYATEITQRTIGFIDTFLVVFANQPGNGRYSDADLTGFRTEFTNLRASLIAVQSSIEAAQAGLVSAADGVRRAELAASGGTTSAADAQIKQALGSLRAAQANLAKTILHSPISGTVNAVSIRTGDFVNSSQQVAEVANNSALEIVTYISDTERDVLAIGDDVTIEQDFSGVVTRVAPAVDAVTRKIEVRIAAENIDVQNGDTVRISKDITTTVETDTVQVPLSAVKFSADNGIVFVVENNRLVARDVEVGVVRGGSVEILSGLSIDEAFVVDARGLQPDTEVEVAK